MGQCRILDRLKPRPIAASVIRCVLFLAVAFTLFLADAAAAAELYGRALSAGAPQPNTTVMLRDGNGRETARTTTDGRGIFRFRGVFPGRYTMTAERGRTTWSRTIAIEPGINRFDLPGP
jgi:hypothetical protein